MITVTIVNIIAVLLTYLQRNNQIRYGFGIAIFLLICFYGIRYDYVAYLNHFQNINGQSNFELPTDSKDLEWGWVLLNRIFEPVGFFVLVFCLTVMQILQFLPCRCKICSTQSTIHSLILLHIYTWTFNYYAKHDEANSCNEYHFTINPFHFK